jgi:hypothetical protein
MTNLAANIVGGLGAKEIGGRRSGHHAITYSND